MSASSKNKKKHKKRKEKHTLDKKETKRSFKTIAIFLKVCVAILFMIIISFVIDSYFLNKDFLKRNLYFYHENISFMNKETFISRIETYQKKIHSKKITLNIKESKVIIIPPLIGLEIQPNVLWDKAYAVGREKTIGKRFISWFKGFFYKRKIFLDFDKKKFEFLVTTWESEAGIERPFEGSVEIKGVDVISKLPKNGEKIDKDKLLSNIIDMFFSSISDDTLTINISLAEDKHIRTKKEIEELSSNVKKFISKPILLANTKFEDISLTLSVHDLVDILNISIPKDTKMKSEIFIDDLAFAEKLNVLQMYDATFKVEKDYSVTIIPGKNGVDVDLEKTKINLMQEILKDQRGIVHIAIHDLLVPDFSSNDAGRLGVKHVVSEFTTHYPCCAARVDNIHLIADLLDNRIIRPGEELNINTFIGERTKEKGFKNAGSILKGEMINSVGGGISQFMTTLHNALYWGGYEIVKHKPHSIYSSRYPHGIDATINWPYVDYILKNDTDAAIIIDTEYTDTSITVRILGDNHSRIITGNHKRWNTPIKIIAKGNNQSRRVISHVEKPFNFHPPVVHFISDEKLPRHKKVLVKTGKKGWETIVDRKIFVGENMYKHDIWPVYYESGKKTLYRIHPCDNWTEKNKPKNC